MTNPLGVPEYRTVVRRIRPARSAVLIPAHEDWHEQVLALMRSYSRTWGGICNVVVPHDEDGSIKRAIWNALRVFDPDYFGATTPAQEPQALKERILKWMSPHAGHGIFVSQQFYPDQPPPGAMTDMCRLVWTPEWVTDLDVSALPAALQVLVTSRSGALMPQHRAVLLEKGAAITTVAADTEVLPLALRYSWTGRAAIDEWWTSVGIARTIAERPDAGEEPTLTSEMFGAVPLALTQYGCLPFGHGTAYPVQPLVVVLGDTVEDFSFSMIRDRLGLQTFWVPLAEGLNDSEIGDIVMQALGQTLARSSRTPQGDRPVIATSISLDWDRLNQEVATLRGRTHWTSSFEIETKPSEDLEHRREFQLLDRVHYFGDSRQPFLGSELVGEIPPLTPTDVVGQETDDCKWQLEVLVPGRNDEPGHILPSRHGLSGIFDRSMVYGTTARTTNEGFSYLSHSMGLVLAGTQLPERLARPQLRLPDGEEVFRTLAGHHGQSVSESQAGRYNRRSVELWGGLEPLARDLRAPAIRRLLEAWRSQVPTSAEAGVLAHQRRFLSLEATTKTSGLAESEVAGILDRFVERSIIRRGLVLTCSRCNDTSFYSVEEFSQSFRCLRCYQENPFLRVSWHKDFSEPRWFYALDEVVFQMLEHNGPVPLLALDLLSQGTRSFLYTFDTVIDDPERGQIEVDLWVIADGRIILGEAKLPGELTTNGEKDVRRAQRLAAVANRYTADRFVMATAAPAWKDRTRVAIRDAFQKFDIEVEELVEVR